MKKRCRKCAQYRAHYAKYHKNQGQAFEWLVEILEEDGINVYDVLENITANNEAHKAIAEMRARDRKLDQRTDRWFYGHLKNKRP